MGLTQDRPLAIYYEHPDWFRPLFAELDRRGTPYARLRVDDHVYDPGDWALRYGLVFNRMSPSAYTRGRGAARSALRACPRVRSRLDHEPPARRFFG